MDHRDCPEDHCVARTVVAGITWLGLLGWGWVALPVLLALASPPAPLRTPAAAPPPDDLHRICAIRRCRVRLPDGTLLPGRARPLLPGEAHPFDGPDQLVEEVERADADAEAARDPRAPEQPAPLLARRHP
jgi:hypothetical protein